MHITFPPFCTCHGGEMKLLSLLLLQTLEKTPFTLFSIVSVFTTGRYIAITFTVVTTPKEDTITNTTRRTQHLSLATHLSASPVHTLVQLGGGGGDDNGGGGEKTHYCLLCSPPPPPSPSPPPLFTNPSCQCFPYSQTPHILS